MRRDFAGSHNFLLDYDSFRIKNRTVYLPLFWRNTYVEWRSPTTSPTKSTSSSSEPEAIAATTATFASANLTGFASANRRSLRELGS